MTFYLLKRKSWLLVKALALRIRPVCGGSVSCLITGISKYILPALSLIIHFFQNVKSLGSTLHAEGTRVWGYAYQKERGVQSFLKMNKMKDDD